jgi:hypothetical protein
VNPPQKPTVRNSFHGIDHAPRDANTRKSPNKKDPIRLMASVAHGNEPIEGRNQSDNKNRVTPPKAAPPATAIKEFVIWKNSKFILGKILFLSIYLMI